MCPPSLHRLQRRVQATSLPSSPLLQNLSLQVDTHPSQPQLCRAPHCRARRNSHHNSHRKVHHSFTKRSVQLLGHLCAMKYSQRQSGRSLISGSQNNYPCSQVSLQYPHDRTAFRYHKPQPRHRLPDILLLPRPRTQDIPLPRPVLRGLPTQDTHLLLLALRADHMLAMCRSPQLVPLEPRHKHTLRVLRVL